MVSCHNICELIKNICRLQLAGTKFNPFLGVRAYSASLRNCYWFDYIHTVFPSTIIICYFDLELVYV